MLTSALAILGALSGIGALVNSILNRKDNNKNAKAVTALESGKLDLTAAELGHDIFMDSLAELRRQVDDCHEERDDFRTILVANGLLLK